MVRYAPNASMNHAAALSQGLNEHEVDLQKHMAQQVCSLLLCVPVILPLLHSAVGILFFDMHGGQQCNTAQYGNLRHCTIARPLQGVTECPNAGDGMKHRIRPWQGVTQENGCVPDGDDGGEREADGYMLL